MIPPLSTAHSKAQTRSAAQTSKHPAHKRPRAHYDPAVIQTIIRIGRERKLSDDHIVTALAVGIQESYLRNLDHGDGSSVGWRQEVHKYYGTKENRMNVRASVGRFYNELERTPRRGRTIGHWGQAVQRSAYPDLYDKHVTEARRILQQYGGSTTTGGAAQTPNTPLL
jgi:hypothetical protein